MMVDHSFIFRVVVAFSIIETCRTRGPLTKKTAVGPTKYPLEVHHLFRSQLSKKPPKPNGIWSAWSSWSPCSRSCGGGITQQTRHCVSRPADSRFGRGQRRRRQQDIWGQKHAGNACIGLYRRIHVCNSQNCPGGRDFRTEQCQSFNGRPFKGKLYFWEPYLQAGDECALNCRAIGMDFYATLNRTVADGTPCSKPHTSHGRRAPPGTKGICIGGNCKFSVLSQLYET